MDEEFQTYGVPEEHVNPPGPPIQTFLYQEPITSLNRRGQVFASTSAPTQAGPGLINVPENLRKPPLNSQTVASSLPL